MLELRMPRVGANDDEVLLGEWFIENGDRVEDGQPIATLETTKEVVELTAHVSGFYQIFAEAGERYRVDHVIAVIADNINELESYNPPRIKADTAVSNSGRTATKKALALANAKGIDLSSIPGHGIIREKDIQHFLAGTHTQKEQDIPHYGINDVVILCGGGFAKMCIELLRRQGGYSIYGVLDTFIPVGTKILDIEVLGNFDDSIAQLREKGLFCAVNAMGGIDSNPDSDFFQLRKSWFLRAKELGFYFPNLIHSDTSLECSVSMGEGNLIFAGAVVSSNVTIGDNTLINTGAIVSHDCMIGSHSRISPGAILAGGITVGENTLIGMGVSIYKGLTIGSNVVIGNGKAIFKDIPDNTVLI